MKKFIRCSVLLLLILTLLCACGKSDEALRVEQLIADIGEVDGSSDAAISQAEDAYDQLSDKDKKDVENYKALVEARNEYDRQKAEVVIGLIDAIDANDDNTLTKIDAALAELERLTDSQKVLVTNAGKLQELRDQFIAIHIQPVIQKIDEATNIDFTAPELPEGVEERLQEAQAAFDSVPLNCRDLVTNADKLTQACGGIRAYHADAVKKLIDAIGTVTPDSEDAITAAENAYNGLTAQEKKLVTNYNDLTKARRSLTTATITTEAKAKKDAGQYKEVCELLKFTDSTYMTDELRTILDECQAQYKKSVMEEAAALAAKGDYTGAAAAITEGQKLVDSPDMNEKLLEYNMKKAEAEQLVTVVRTAVEDSYIYSYAYVTIKNMSDKVIKEYAVAMIMLDSNGYPVNNSYSFDCFRGYKNVKGGRADSANVQPGRTYGESSYWMIEGKCDRILACVISAEFYDGTTWENPYLDVWLELYAEKPVL